MKSISLLLCVHAVLIVSTATSPYAIAQDTDSVNDERAPYTDSRKRFSGTVVQKEISDREPNEVVNLHGYSLAAADKQVALMSTQGITSRLARGTQRTFGGIPDALPEDVRPRDDAYYVVTTSAEQKFEMRDAVESVGGRVVESTKGAWVVSLNGAQAEELEEMRSGQQLQTDDVWIGRYRPEFKVTPALEQHIEYLKRKDDTGIEGGGPTLVLPPDLAPAATTDADEDTVDADDDPVAAFDLPGNLDDGDDEPLVFVTIYLFQGEKADSIVGILEKLDAVDIRTGETASSAIIRAKVPVDNIDRIANLEPVQAIDPFVAPSKRNDVAAQIIGAPPTNTTPFQGANQVVGHADSGLDVGINDASIHEAFQGRLKQAFALGRANDWSDWDGHGTHTAGSIVGAGSAFRGMAPEAELVHQSIGDQFGGLGGIPPNYGTLFEQAYDLGARVHSDSWGINVSDATHLARKYLNGRQIDQWTWNSGNVRDMLIVVANGNDGQHGVGSPATAKNSLSVGATETSRPAFVKSNADNPNDFATFSSVGPTEDGRIKPDIVAPGTWIASAKTQAERLAWSSDVENQGDWGTTSGFTWSTVSALSGTHAWRSQHAAGDVFSDIARTGVFNTPDIGPMFVQFSVFGNVGNGNRLCVAGRRGSQNWMPIECINQSLHQDWTNYSIKLLNKLTAENNVQLAIFVSSSSPSLEDVDVFIDDVQVTSFDCWGTIGNENLDTPGGAVDRLYTLCGGTSMATPIVAGAAAVLRESLVQAGETTPSAELLKALMINSADSMGRARPNNQTGWGRLDLDNALTATQLFDYSVALEQDQQVTYDFEVLGASTPLRATVVWADPPGEQLVNNLDLMLRDPGEHPTTGACEFSTLPDAVNNVESVDVASPAAGMWKLDVCGSDVQNGPQPFAIVIAGDIQ